MGFRLVKIHCSDPFLGAGSRRYTSRYFETDP